MSRKRAAMQVSLDRQLMGWANYLSMGYLHDAFRQIDTFLRQRLTVRARRRTRPRTAGLATSIATSRRVR
jgi:hypothetical protein